MQTNSYFVCMYEEELEMRSNLTASRQINRDKLSRFDERPGGGGGVTGIQVCYPPASINL